MMIFILLVTRHFTASCTCSEFSCKKDLHFLVWYLLDCAGDVVAAHGTRDSRRVFDRSAKGWRREASAETAGREGR